MKIKARLNHGRWIADCPKCNGSDIVYPGYKFYCGNVECDSKQHRAFFAQGAIVRAAHRGESEIRLEGWNIGLPIKKAKKKLEDIAIGLDIVWPKEKDKIDELVKSRPVEAKNWEIGESVAFLERENKQHGVGN